MAAGLLIAVAAASRGSSAGPDARPTESPRAWREENARQDLAGPEGSRIVFLPSDTASSLRRLATRDRAGWTFSFEGWLAGRAALVLAGETLYAAVYSEIASGCHVVALDVRSGALRWAVALEGAGPVAHSKYQNRVQMEVTPAGVVIHGDESVGRYTEVVSPSDGHQISHQFFSNLRAPSRLEGRHGTVVSPPWRWDRSAEAKPRQQLAGPAGSRFAFSTRTKDEPPSLRRIDARGVPVWRHAVAGPAGDRADLVLDGETLYAAIYASDAPGCWVAALDARSGALRWEAKLRGWGQAAHEGGAQKNRVQMKLWPMGLAIYAVVSEVRYIDVLRAADGRDLNEDFRPR